jgi:sporulation protein YlmC with PRC-barrel domain
MDPARRGDVMRLSELQNLPVKTLDGEKLGRVHEVHCENGRIVALTCGPGSFIERLTAKKSGRRIPWECVKRIERKALIVTPDSPHRRPKPSASRTRQGTRRPSGRPSKR